jgi:hypothetical protein
MSHIQLLPLAVFYIRQLSCWIFFFFYFSASLPYLAIIQSSRVFPIIGSLHSIAEHIVSWCCYPFHPPPRETFCYARSEKIKEYYFRLHCSSVRKGKWWILSFNCFLWQCGQGDVWSFCSNILCLCRLLTESICWRGTRQDRGRRGSFLLITDSVVAMVLSPPVAVSPPNLERLPDDWRVSSYLKTQICCMAEWGSWKPSLEVSLCFLMTSAGIMRPSNKLLSA